MVRILFMVIIVLLGHTSLAQSIDSLVIQIAEVNVVYAKHVGRSGSDSKQYQRYQKLLSKASIPDLLALTNHKNKAVKCYAGWGLIDKGYSEVDIVFEKFLKKNKKVEIFKGCLKGKDWIASSFYHKYRNKVSRKKDNVITVKDDGQLFKMDSIILYTKNIDWQFLHAALKNRIYPTSFLSQINRQAFKYQSLSAIEYLFKNHLEDHKENIQDALVKYLKKREIWPSEYEFIFDALYSFKQENLNEIMLKALNKIDKRQGSGSSNRYNDIFKKPGFKNE